MTVKLASPAKAAIAAAVVVLSSKKGRSVSAALIHLVKLRQKNRVSFLALLVVPKLSYLQN